MRGGLVLVTAVSVVAAPGVAHAGRSFFGWLYGSEVMPERSVELQNWITEENKVEEDANRSYSIWGVGPQIGITDQLELGLPLEISWDRVPGMPGRTTIADYGVDVRYRFVTQDPEDAPDFAPLLRVALERSVLARDALIAQADLVGTYETGIVAIGANIGVAYDVSRDDHQGEMRTGLGISVLAIDELRFGAEGFGEFAIDDGASWAAAGPNLSWTHGRFWVSASYGIGVYQIKTAPRMQWGIAF